MAFFSQEQLVAVVVVPTDVAAVDADDVAVLVPDVVVLLPDVDRDVNAS